jgi:thymidylate kinase
LLKAILLNFYDSGSSMINLISTLIICFVNIQAFSANLIGISIEGCDYAGKTTIVNELKWELKDEKLLKLNHRFISEDKGILDLSKKAWDSLPTDIPSRFPDTQFFESFNEIMTECFTTDLQNYKSCEDNRIYILQDRSWISQACMNLYFTPDLENRTHSVTQELYLPFQYNIFLHCAPDARVQRARERDIIKTPDSIDKYFVKHATDLVEFDRYCLDFIKERIKKNNEQWLVIDTTNYTKEETTKKILKFVQ